MNTYVKVLGVLHMLVAGLAGLLALVTLYFARAMGVMYALYPPADAALSEMELRAAANYDQAFLAFVACCVLLFSLASLITGIGLLWFRPWARKLGIGVSIFDLLLPPFGTVFGIYSLCVLLPKATRRLFTPIADSEASTIR